MQDNVERESRPKSQHTASCATLDSFSLVAQLPGMHISLALDLSVLALSDDYARLLGRPAAELIGCSIFELPTGQLGSLLRGTELRDSLRRVLAGGGRHVMRPVELPGKQPRQVRVTHSPVLGADGQRLYIHHQLEDLSELQSAVSRADAASHELEAFCYAVAHDLRAPLRAMDGFSQALLDDYSERLDAPAQALLTRVRKGAQRMAQLIDDLLGLSRATRRPLQLTPVDLSALASQVVASLQRAQPDRAVEVHIEPGLSAHGDASLLEAVLDGLISNAWKFTSASRHGRIEVGASQQDMQRVYHVRDNGVGFEMAYAHKLFAPFQRLHGEQEFEGTGIGLATVQRIVKRHGGSIWPESRKGEGACFFFTLAG